jgi:hypothetical protein
MLGLKVTPALKTNKKKANGGVVRVEESQLWWEVESASLGLGYPTLFAMKLRKGWGHGAFVAG